MKYILDARDVVLDAVAITIDDVNIYTVCCFLSYRFDIY